MKSLFELKTDLSNTNIYIAVGQLMIHGAGQAPPPKRVLVVPGKPEKETAKSLQDLSIQVVSYKWDNGPVHFEGIDDIL